MAQKPHISAFITGAAGGIADAVVKRLAENYSGTLSLADIDKKGLRAAREKHSQSDLEILTFDFDLTHKSELKSAIDTAAKQGNGLDFLFNNAGVMTSEAAFENATNAQISLSYQVNFTTVIDACHLAWPYLSKSRGCVINNASGAGKIPFPGDPVYSASKAGVIMFTKSQALRYDETAIRFNAVCPGVVDTPILLDKKTGDYKSDTQKFLKMFHLLTSDDIAEAVLEQYQSELLNGDIRSIVNRPRQ